ncbi:alcohol dehydrogenase catalytic domain-containing protein [Streptomyces sp. NPDC059814]|uniref:alcohol dehydrogenase catalytic domain-containing protein n=1 Tax=Streptomyces sp. NPDC059814 TaxID=3346959 RepID=UPI00365F463E
MVSHPATVGARNGCGRVIEFPHAWPPPDGGYPPWGCRDIRPHAGDVRVENIPDPQIVDPTDAIVRITLACVCGSDLHPYHSMEKTDEGAPMGHEFLGVVEETGSEVRGLKRGDFVVSPFAFADNTCPICRDGLHTACPHGGWYGVGGAQASWPRAACAASARMPAVVSAATVKAFASAGSAHLAARLVEVRWRGHAFLCRTSACAGPPGPVDTILRDRIPDRNDGRGR